MSLQAYPRVEAVLSWLADRLSEKSTYLGIGLLLAAGGLSLAPDLSSALVNLGIAVAGVLAVLIKDKVI